MPFLASLRVQARIARYSALTALPTRTPAEDRERTRLHAILAPQEREEWADLLRGHLLLCAQVHALYRSWQTQGLTQDLARRLTALRASVPLPLHDDQMRVALRQLFART